MGAQRTMSGDDDGSRRCRLTSEHVAYCAAHAANSAHAPSPSRVPLPSRLLRAGAAAARGEMAQWQTVMRRCPDIVVLILEALGTRDLCVLGGAFRGLHEECRRPCLWRVVTLGALRARNSAAFTGVLRGMQPQLAHTQEIVLPAGVPFAGWACDMLRELLPDLRTVVFDQFTADAVVARVLKALPHLRSVRGAWVIPEEVRPALEELYLTGWGACCLRRRDAGVWSELPRLLPSLQILRLPRGKYDRNDEDYFGDGHVWALQGMASLVVLDLSGAILLTDPAVRAISRRFPKLRSLSLRLLGPHVTDGALDALRQSSAPLDKLDMRECVEITQENASYPLYQSRRLLCTRISADAIELFREARPEVEFLIS